MERVAFVYMIECVDSMGRWAGCCPTTTWQSKAKQNDYSSSYFGILHLFLLSQVRPFYDPPINQINQSLRPPPCLSLCDGMFNGRSTWSLSLYTFCFGFCSLHPIHSYDEEEEGEGGGGGGGGGGGSGMASLLNSTTRQDKDKRTTTIKPPQMAPYVSISLQTKEK
jgi:hypothetical protein